MNTDTGNSITNHSSASISWTKIFLRALLLTVIVFLITEVPYLVAYSKTPDGYTFTGQLSEHSDKNMYFSFIRQAANGHLLFINRLSYLSQNPVFFNLEWLLVGKVMSLLGGSTRWAYDIWRFAGAFMLIFGFSALAETILINKTQRLTAILLCVFGGGFGWFYNILARLGWTSFNRYAVIDQWTTGHPFAQIMFNPSHSLPLGFLCLIFVFYVKGEGTGNKGPYFAAALLAAIDGVIRPYDLIALSVIIPLYICIETIRSSAMSRRQILLRLLPLLVTVPLIFYYAYLFHWHPAYKYWAIQGRPQWVPLPWHLLSLGIAGVLCVLRLCIAKQFPLDNAGRLLLVWIISVLVFSHAYKLFGFMAYSMQLSTSLMPPIILLGCALISKGTVMKSKRFAISNIYFIFFLIAINSLSSLFIVRNVLNFMAAGREYYVPIAEMDSFAWLNRQGDEQDVVLSSLDSGNLLGKYTDKKIAIGHYSLTPDIVRLKRNVDRFFAGNMSEDEARRFLNYLNVNWIYAGKRETTFSNSYLQTLAGLKKCYDNQGVIIYAAKRNPLQCSSPWK